LQSRGVPAQAPAALHVSTDVHGSPSSHPAPGGSSGYTHEPAVQTPGSTWHDVGGSPQVMPMHGSAAHKPEAASQPAGHGVSVVTNVHVPLEAEQMPPESVREALPTQVGKGGKHTTVDPLQTPLPSHWSPVVQASASSQVVPCVLNAYEHAPLTGLQVPVDS
jgi:hypothetical protein